MADINYQKVGWDVNKYVNPTNMNQMDNGIKAACDKADQNAKDISENAKAISEVNSNLGALPIWHLQTDGVIQCKAGYGAFLMVGFMNNIGAVSIVVHVQQGNVHLYNNNGEQGATEHITVEYRDNNLYIKPQNSYGYNLVIIGAGAP